MSSSNPLISVIIPCFNRANLVAETLDSVSEQSYDTWECWVVDDHSTDDSWQVVMQYVQRDDRIKLVKNERTKGAQGARNTGITYSTGDFLIFLDSDDLLHKECLANRTRFFHRSPYFDFYCFPTQLFRHVAGDSVLLWNYLHKEEDDLNRFLRQDAPWHTSGVLWKRETVEKVGFFEEGLPCWQDWEYHMRALIEGFSYKKAPDDPDQVDTFYRLESSHDQIHKKSDSVSYRLGVAKAVSTSLQRLEKGKMLNKPNGFWMPSG
jgi:glycosyltransferase involved in cell wall biosynthesis